MPAPLCGSPTQPNSQDVWSSAERPTDVPDDATDIDHVWRWTVNVALQFTYSSPSSAQLIGYSAAELIGQSVIVVIDPAELSRAIDFVDAIGGPRPTMPMMVVTCRHSDGSRSWFEIEFEPNFGADGQIIDFRGSSRMIGPNSSTVMAHEETRQRIETLIENRLLLTAFQPIVDLVRAEVVGVEALTRFVTEPALSPDSYFTAATSVGLGTQLELLALETAMTSASQLPDFLYVSFNVSPVTCLTKEFVELMNDTSLDPRRIVLELTEHSRVDDYFPLNAVLAALRKRGIRIAVDDAGAGFASFQHILQLQPEIIKLDRCIIAGIDADPGRWALAQAVLTFAGYINAQVVAEGIETEAELSAVRRIGMMAGQGYLFGRPSVAPQAWHGWPLAPSANLSAAAVQQVWPAEIIVDATQRLWVLAGDLDGTGPRVRHPGDGMQQVGPVPEDTVLAAVLDALPDATAVLDRDGTIVSANEAWRMFALDNGGRPSDTAVGVNYLDVCLRSAAAGSTDAQEIATGLRALLDGRKVEVDREYACHSPTVSRWFSTRIKPIAGPVGGAIASHVNITRRKWLEDEFAHQASHDPLTGLANRALLTQTLTTSMCMNVASRGTGDTGVIYLDLDDFKPVNDRFGHAAGDEVLQHVDEYNSRTAPLSPEVV